VTAEYGGTGGRPLEAGMTLEEPDIEIGAGVSSKAISQKIHLRGNQNQEGGRGGGGRGRGRGRGADRDNQAWNQREDVSSPGGTGGGLPQGFPPFPMMPGQQGMFPGGPFPPGQFPPFMMPPQMQAFFQQQFGGQQGQQQQGQQGLEGYGFGDQQGEGGQ
jgi:protein NRD1